MTTLSQMETPYKDHHDPEDAFILQFGESSRPLQGVEELYKDYLEAAHALMPVAQNIDERITEVYTTHCSHQPDLLHRVFPSRFDHLNTAISMRRPDLVWPKPLLELNWVSQMFLDEVDTNYGINCKEIEIEVAANLAEVLPLVRQPLQNFLMQVEEHRLTHTGCRWDPRRLIRHTLANVFEHTLQAPTHPHHPSTFIFAQAAAQYLMSVSGLFTLHPQPYHLRDSY